MLKAKALAGRVFKLIGVLAVVLGLGYGLVSRTYREHRALRPDGSHAGDGAQRAATA